MRTLLLAIAIACAAGPAFAQDPNAPPPAPTIEQLIGQEVGPIVVHAAVCEVGKRTLQAANAALQKQVADLNAELAKLKDRQGK